MDIYARFDVAIQDHPTIDEVDDPDYLHTMLIHVL